MKRFLVRAAFLGALAGLIYGLAPLSAPWFAERFLPARLTRAGADHMERLDAMHRRALEVLRALDGPASPSWGELASARDRLAPSAFLLAADADDRPQVWAGRPRSLRFVEGVRAAFTPDRSYLVHAVSRRWGRLTAAQPLPLPEPSLFIHSAAFQPATSFPALPGPEDPDTQTFLFKPGGPPLLALQLHGVPAEEAIRSIRRAVGGVLALGWLVLLIIHRRALPRWSLFLLGRLALLLAPLGFLPLPSAWTDPAVFSLPAPWGVAGSPLDGALTLLAAGLALAASTLRPCKTWTAYVVGFAATALAALGAAYLAVRGAPLGPLPLPLWTALVAAAWVSGWAALRLCPPAPPPRWIPWLAVALLPLLLGLPLPAFAACLAAGSLGLAVWRREPAVGAALAALWGLALPHAIAAADLRDHLRGPHAMLRLQRPSLEAVELGQILPGLLAGWDWRERVDYFPLVDDPSPLAYTLARAVGLEGRGIEYCVALHAEETLVSLSRTAHFPLLDPDAAPSGALRADPQEPGLYAGAFPLLDGGRPWGSAVIQFRPLPPASPSREHLPVLLALYDGEGNPLEAGSVFLPPRLGPGSRPDLPGWSEVVVEGDRQALFYLPPWEFPFPHLPFALLLLAGVFLSFPRPFHLRGLLTLAMLPLAALLALAAALAFSFMVRQERDLRALQEQWTAVAQKNLLDEAAGVHPDLVYRDGLLEGGSEVGPTMAFAPAPLMAALPLARPRTVEVRGRPYLFFTDTEGRLCALRQLNLPGLERPAAWLARRTWGLLLSSLACAFMLLLVLLRRFTEPVARLAESARAVQRGEPFAPEGLSASREINDLALALGEAIERLSHEERTLREILAALPVGVALERDGTILFQNAPMEASGLAEGDPGALPDRGTLARAGRLYLIRRVPLPGGRRLLLASDISAEVTAEKLTAFAEIARIVAHEVKNPLTPIRLSIDYLRELLGRDEARFRRDAPAVLREVVLSVDDLEHAAMEFADFARLPALQKTAYDLGALAADWLAPYRASGAVRFAAPGEPLRVEADPRLLKRALFNLLANAWQSASPPPPVTVRLEAWEGWAGLSVEDEGPGVPPEALPRLFEPYFTTKSSGTGLGLLIARRIVEEHGGSIEARNRAGGGLVVEIRLPLVQS